MNSFYIKTACLNHHAVIRKGRYHDGSTALALFDVETGEPLAKATVVHERVGAKPADEHHVA